MTTERQVEANRLNAIKSTGPRTPAGKAMVRHNAMKHGLLSRESLVKGESETELGDFGKRLLAQLVNGLVRRNSQDGDADDQTARRMRGGDYALNQSQVELADM